MKKTLLRTLCVVAAMLICGHVSAQEEVTAITPLKITSGLNADVIAEAKANANNTTKNSERQKNSEGSYETVTNYTSKLASIIDGEAIGGRNAFYTTSVQEEGAIKYKTENGNTYLDGNTDGIPYLMEAATTKNALLIKSASQQHTLALSKVDGTALPVASSIYLLATSAEGASTVKVSIIGSDNQEIGTTTVEVGDWWASHSSTKLTEVYETQRIIVKGKAVTDWRGNVSWNGEGEEYINYINKGKDNEGTFWLQRIAVSTLSTEPIKEIRITKTSTTGHLVVFAATAVTEEVTEKDSQTTLDYLINTTTNQRIAETVKYRVNLHRNFKADMWQPFVFNCELTAAQAKTMFGNDVKLSKITDQSYQDTRIIFYPVDLTNGSDVVIKKGEYYLIKIPSGSIAAVDATTNLQKYTCDYVQFRACEDYGTGLTMEKTISNTNGDGSTATFHGVYVSGKNIGVGSYAVSGGKFYKYTDDPQIGAFRFWMTISGSLSTAKEMALDIADETTAIATVGVDGASDGNVYTIDGRMVRQGSTSLEGLAKGLYIVNKKKVMVK